MNLKTVQEDKIKELEYIATALRISVLEMLSKAGSGHSAGALGTAEIFASLYFHVLNIDPQDPTNPNRDRFVLSNGHICPILYAALAHRGYFPLRELTNLRKLGSVLQGHPHNLELPGIETSSGPLGQGFSQATGMALAAELDKRDFMVYCMTSDAELQEGQTWEAAMFAANKNLNNLAWIIDRNMIQIEGNTEEVMPLEPLEAKLKAFNWEVLEVDGHNTKEIIDALEQAKKSAHPTAVIAKTIPGKGVEFMEYKFEWHGKPPTKEQAKEAIEKLRLLLPYSNKEILNESI